MFWIIKRQRIFTQQRMKRKININLNIYTHTANGNICWYTIIVIYKINILDCGKNNVNRFLTNLSNIQGS